MKKSLTAALSALLVTLVLALLPAAADTGSAHMVSADATSTEMVSAASDVSTPPLFFDQSEADSVPDGYDSQPSPVVWIFVVGGVAALGAVGVLVWVNRRQDR